MNSNSDLIFQVMTVRLTVMSSIDELIEFVPGPNEATMTEWSRVHVGKFGTRVNENIGL